MRAEYVTSNIAIAEGAMASGLKFFAGYPITPTSDILEYLAEELPKRGGVVIQLEDEIASINAVIGASWAGAKAMTATSSPGYSLMVEALSFAIITETPLVVVYVMRAGPSTGVPTRSCQYDVFQVRYGSHGNYELPVLVPWSAQEAFDLTVKAFNVSEMLRVPTVILSDAMLAHTWEKVIIRNPSELKIISRRKPEVPPQEYMPFKPGEDLVPPMACFGDGYKVMVESLTHDERGYYSPTTEVQERMIRRLVEKVRRNSRLIIDYETYFTSSAEYIFFAYGSTARSVYALVKELRREGIRAGLYRPKALWPFDEGGLKKIASEAKRVFVVENNVGLMYKEVAQVLRDKEVISVGIIDLDVPSPDRIKEVISEWL
ncbi:MAG: 2-oxoacid:acceptor oxidoreductase subunit alpha [Desulfurococcales archaeon]|nr:2-oxoacid:acceptor oxidoreductase subunit alpha [Desulfurococcales archaeon]